MIDGLHSKSHSHKVLELSSHALSSETSYSHIHSFGHCLSGVEEVTSCMEIVLIKPKNSNHPQEQFRLK